MLIVSNVLDGEHEYLRAQFSESQVMLLPTTSITMHTWSRARQCSPLHVQHDRLDNLFFKRIKETTLTVLIFTGAGHDIFSQKKPIELSGVRSRRSSSLQGAPARQFITNMV